MRPFFCALALALLCCFPTAARAGTYDVSTCQPPGGSGGDGAAWQLVPGSGAGFTVDQDCAGGLGVRTAPPATQAPLEAAILRFSAPAGARIVRARLWRSGYSFGNGWRSGGRIDASGLIAGNSTAQAFDPDNCDGDEGQFPCTWGDTNGTAAPPLDFTLNASSLEYLVVCGVQNATSCPAGNAENFPYAGATLYASQLTLQEDVPPVVSLGGPATAPGWHPPSAGVTFTATDPTGIRASTLLVDGQPFDIAPSTCRSDRPKPCEDVSRTAQPLPDGRHTLTYQTLDGASNPGAATATADIDGTPPAIAFVPGSGRTVTVDAPDATSGLASGKIEIASKGKGFRALKTTRRGATLRARLGSRRPAGLVIRATATDVAGNTTTADSDRALRVGAGFGSRRIAYVEHGRGRTLTGRVRNRTGEALAGVPVLITPTTLVRGSKAGKPIVVTTDARGRFRYRAPAGFSRRLQVKVPSVGGEPGITVNAALLVHAASTIRARPASVGAGGSVRFTGKLKRRGARIPKGGKLLDLQGFENGRWRTFETVRSSRTGNWRAGYRFSGGARGTFRIRIRIRRESTYPFHVGASRTVKVRVR